MLDCGPSVLKHSLTIATELDVLVTICSVVVLPACLTTEFLCMDVIGYTLMS